MHRHGGVHFTISIWPDTAARTISEALQAAGGASQSRNIKDAVAAHPAVEEETFDLTFKPRHRLFESLRANEVHNRAQRLNSNVNGMNNQPPGFTHARSRGLVTVYWLLWQYFQHHPAPVRLL